MSDDVKYGVRWQIGKIDVTYEMQDKAEAENAIAQVDKIKQEWDLPLGFEDHVGIFTLVKIPA